MQPRKLKLMIATYSYGGNGGISSEHPDVRNYLIKTIIEAKADPRIECVMALDYADTPITMTRNRSVVEARQHGADILLMIDSDQAPDMYLNSPDSHGRAKPFFQSSLDHIYKHWDKGPSAVFAPYCGPPPNENVYMFDWVNTQSEHPNDTDMSLGGYSREHATSLSGIKECAAAPTGLCLWDMRCFDVTEPDTCARDEQFKGWFYYEYKNKYAAEKNSTEDVTATRDLSMIGLIKLGYNPVFVNWDAWAGHWKPKCVGKPILIEGSTVSEKFRAAVLRRESGAQIVTKTLDPRLAALFQPPPPPPTMTFRDEHGGVLQTTAKDNGLTIANCEDVKLAAVNGD